MTEPVLASPTPFFVEVEAGKSYRWCACGRSKSQPFCDGSHKTTSFAPREYKASETRVVMLCGCKRSRTAPICDGTHNRL
ncbi:MAG: CDGSH iron-sulfur domain-containing protein [Alphaproteobacteria bacterium]|nr:CDGSH iron-sulfur domain-containing protein [Alphaproteobacteria bacterium]